jgi:hypothetical protein
MADNRRFQKRSGVFTCNICQRRTRHTGETDIAFNDSCDACTLDSLQFNSESDAGVPDAQENYDLKIAARRRGVVAGARVRVKDNVAHYAGRVGLVTGVGGTVCFIKFVSADATKADRRRATSHPLFLDEVEVIS